jgi:hypothetical protein
MGQAQTAVPPEDSSVLHANPAQLVSLSAHSLSTTSGVLGMDRSLYSMAYNFPIRMKKPRENEGVLSVQDQDLVSGRQMTSQPPAREASPQPSISSDYELLQDLHTASGGSDPNARHSADDEPMGMAVAAGATFFGVKEIEGRSEFGALEADFQDSERAIYLAYACNVYPHLNFGITGKYLGQTLQSASAKGFSFDLGTTYQVPLVQRGRLDVAFAAKDLGGQLKWEVADTQLDTEYSYKESVLAKMVLGTAYTTPQKRWVFALDLAKVHKQDLRPYAGAEWRTNSFLALRGGMSYDSPSMGMGLNWRMRSAQLKLDYAFQYSTHSFVNPHWITLSWQFLPFKTGS